MKVICLADVTNAVPQEVFQAYGTTASLSDTRQMMN